MSDHGPVEGERTVSAVAGTRRRWLSRSQAIMLIVLGTFAIIVLVFWKNPGVKPKEDEAAAVPRIGRMVPYEPPKPEAIIPVVAKPSPPPVIIQAPPMKQVVEAIVETPKVQRPAMLSYSVPALSEAQKPKVAATREKGEGADTTKVVYKTATVVGSKAGLMADRALTLMPGLIRCTLTTAIDSNLSGPLMCTLPVDVLSPSGAVLMEKGTQVMGNYNSHVTQGQKRLLTVAATAYTPNGVVVPLGGPMSDALGRTGLDGEVDNHYFERFGGAVLLSLIDSGFSVLQSALSKGNNNTDISVGGGGSGVGSLAQEVLRNTINIPPTIRVNEGSDVNLWVTTPIDFNAVYKLTPRNW